MLKNLNAMKAFKSISYKKEISVFWGYSMLLTMISFLVILSPVFAQSDSDIFTRPDVKVEVKKEYDENGNLICIDSTVVRLMGEFPDSSSWYLSNPFANGFPGTVTHGVSRGKLHPFWDWNEQDSTAISYFEDLFGFDFFAPPSDFGLFNNDSLIPADSVFSHFYEPGKREQLFDQQKRMEGYFKEQQKLIEKYFGSPNKKSESSIKNQSEIKI